MIENPNYYSIVPADVRYDDDLDFGARLLYSEITALTNKKGFCFALNKYFATLYKTSEKTISRWITSLTNKGYIFVEVIKNNEGTKRVIKIKQGLDTDEVGVGHRCPTGLDTDEAYNITRVNNIKNNNINIITKKTNKFTPPTPQEVQNEINLKNYLIDAEAFIAYYDSNGWMVGRTKMKCWKSALVTWHKKTKAPTNQFMTKSEKNKKAIEERAKYWRQQSQGYIEGELL